ncbi:MAG: hypothetical protein HY039_08545 [Nitrospirae bacterium]|nr:hypothetical protein [Nitrospirota bacterium]
MEIARKLLEGSSWEPFERIGSVLALGEGDLLAAMGALTVLFFGIEFAKVYLMIERGESVRVHVTVNVMTILPALILVLVLIHAGAGHPDRVWINLIFAVLAFVPWYAAGQAAFLARRDVEGGDVGFMSIGLLIVLSTGAVVAAIA